MNGQEKLSNTAYNQPGSTQPSAAGLATLAAAGNVRLMKLLACFHTSEEASGLKDYLEECGIAVYMEYERPRGTEIAYSIFVALESQYDDAVNLMNNSDHIVATGIDVEEYQNYVQSQEGKIEALSFMLKHALIALIFLAASAGIIVYVVTRA